MEAEPAALDTNPAPITSANSSVRRLVQFDYVCERGRLSMRDEWRAVHRTG
jgi:hypothetical protein